jgi:membrane protease YdiL (CAAX protease family)
MSDREEAPNNDTPEHPGGLAGVQSPPASHPVYPIEVQAEKAQPAELQSPEPDTIKMGTPVEQPVYVSLDDIQRAGPLPGDPMAAAAMPSSKPQRILPEDLRVSWSWPHLILFLFFGFASLLVVQLSFVFYVSANRHLSANQVQAVFESSPQLLVGTNVLWYGLLFLFLYMTLAVLREAPFWRTLGWRKLNADPAAGKDSGWMYFFSGCGLAIFVAVASYNVKNADHLPIEEIFKNRGGALLLMAMAVLIAPLVEETVFRGYLYPLFAKSLGVVPGILITGLLFGLMHGSQLGWTWSLVLLLTFVGVIFTFARARTGTVLASFLMHLGYNSMIAVSSIIATKGFQHMPTP